MEEVGALQERRRQRSSGGDYFWGGSESGGGDGWSILAWRLALVLVRRSGRRRDTQWEDVAKVEANKQELRQWGRRRRRRRLAELRVWRVGR